MTVTLRRYVKSLMIEGHGDPLYVAAADVPLLVHGHMVALKRFVDFRLEDVGVERDALKIIWTMTFAFGSGLVIVGGVDYGVNGVMLAIGMLAFMASIFSLVVLAN